ncbi:MAG: polyhydroxyalkanoic acid system family protein [Gammaproteobacteria bacterium]|nr:polyhydroxyalkanoic acid system family protein [Gammaproteobacteria bacterium]NNL50969.1 polyhydroxyalkanoic acid system protein [Woeseiaceae bacterium]
MKIQRRHSLGLEEARRRADEIAEHLGRQFTLTSHWQGDQLLVSGNGVNGYLEVTGDSVELEVRLGLALKLMERPIRSAIENTIDEHLV